MEEPPKQEPLQEPKRRRRFLLSIDGGGGRLGRLSLLIIEKILQVIQEERQKRSPAELRPGTNATQAYHVFDLAGGTGAGGLVVIMLFRLQMDVATARIDYNKLTRRVRSARTAGIVSTVEGSRYARLGLCFESIINKYRGNVLEKKRSIFLRFFKAPKMVNEHLDSRALTCARRAARDDTDFFVSWEKQENNWEKITIIDAAMATCAFSTAGVVTIKDKDNAKRTYNGNPLVDPHREVLDEARKVMAFIGDPTVLITIGPGGPGATKVDDVNGTRFDFKCDVMDGWTQDDGAGAVGSNNLPEETIVLIKEFVEMYLGPTTRT